MTALDLALNFSVARSLVDEHQEGLTAALLARLVRWGMTIDPDQKVDVFTFGEAPESAYFAGRIDQQASIDFMCSHVIGRVPGYDRGKAHFSPVLELNLQHFGWTAPTVQGNLLEQVWSYATAPLTRPSKKRSLIITVSDGHNGDEQATEAVLAASAARQDEVYFLFLGVSNQDTVFPFINLMGERFDNVGFVAVPDVMHWVEQSDDAIGQTLIGSELVAWLGG